MRRAWMVFALIVVAFVWWIGSRLSTDALAIVVGMVFGVAAAVPAAVIAWVVADMRRERTQTAQEGPQAQQHVAPVVVYLADRHPTQRPSYAAPAGLFAPPSARVVGEREAWVDGEGWAR